MSVIVDFSLFPLDKGESLSRFVARAVKTVEASGLPYRLHAMGTTVEGEWEEVMDVIGRCYKQMAAESDRVYLALKADCRKGPLGRMRDKVESVKRKL